jgi:photosystem II stability/assembly factor-like uncharacterized protein
MAKRIALLTALLSLVVTSLAFAGGHDYGWQLTPTGSVTPTPPPRLRGLSAISERVAWTSGSAGTVLRATNKGATRQSVGPPGTASLQFRDIVAFDADTAVILSIGNGTDSRIYRTTYAGQTWSLVFVNDDPLAFYDCMAWFDKHRGLALSDPVNGRFRILATNDGGRSWQVLDADMPPALPAEFAFAASGQCITHGRRAGCLVRHGRRRGRAGLPIRRSRPHVDGREHACPQLAERRNLRARLPGSPARARSRWRLRGADGLPGRTGAQQ